MSTLIWIGWLLYFAVFEGYALWKHRTDETFSWQVWRLEHQQPAFHLAVAALLGWLFVHFEVMH